MLNQMEPEFKRLCYWLQGFWVLQQDLKPQSSKSCSWEKKSRTSTGTVPRTYTLSPCDFTANLTLTISNIIHRDKVLEAVIYGDSHFFRENQELMDALGRVYFHSSFKKYNRMECWGPLKDAALGKGENNINGHSSASKKISRAPKSWGSPKSIFQALVTFLL